MPAGIDPPGHLAIHLEIVALTPILLCWAGFLAGVILGAGRGTRIIASIGITLGLGLLLLDLRSRGFALAVDRVLGREWFPPGIARVSWPTMAFAAVAGISAVFTSIRQHREIPGPRAAWACGLAMSLALVPLPALVGLCDGTGIDEEMPGKTADFRGKNRRWLPLCVALPMTLVACFTASPWPFGVTAALGVIICKRQRVALIIAVLATCRPFLDGQPAVPG
jgi:hypothetical protein